MPSNFIILLTVLFICFSGNLHSIGAQTCTKTDSLLARAYQRDQDIRLKFMKLTQHLNNENLNQTPTTVIDSLVELKVQMEAIDQQNQHLLASLLQNGFPKGLSPQSYKTIWLIVDHADLKLQTLYLPLMQEAVTKGLISASNYATLTDRIRMKEGKPQIYGTQSYTVTIDAQQITYIWPVEEPERLNDLRKEIGVGSIEEYIQLLKTTTGSKVIYQPDLTIDQMREKGLLDAYPFQKE